MWAAASDSANPVRELTRAPARFTRTETRRYSPRWSRARELGSYLRSPIGWVIIAVLLLVDGILFQAFALRGEQLSAVVLESYSLGALPLSRSSWATPQGVAGTRSDRP